MRLSKENIWTVQSAVRGFREKLKREHEEINKYDLFAIKVCRPLDRKIIFPLKSWKERDSLSLVEP